MVHSVLTGESAFQHCHGEPLFPYLATHPRAAALFHEAMSGFSDRETTAILEAYDFSGLSKVVDVGGGHGALIAALLNTHQNLYGVILDLETAADGARQLLAQAGVAQRAVFVPGDFFSKVPRGGDAYVLKSVIHNWDDEAATKILRACRQAMRSDARLIAIERVIPPGNAASEAKLFDINMLVSVGGQERTEDEYRSLFRGAGLRLTRIVQTRSPLSLIEGVPANGA
jgi:O-methyltransferase